MLLQNTVTEATRTLDIGCGRRAPVLSELTGVRFGVDLVPDFNVSSGIHVVRANAEELPFPSDYFDVVVSTSVLEHVERPDRVLTEIARVLKPGGRCFVLTPNKWDYVSILARIVPNRWHGAVVKRMTGRPEEDTFPTLYRANTARTIQRLAKSSGLTASIELRRQHPHYLKQHWLLYAVGGLMEAGLQRPFPVLRPWIQATMSKQHSDSRSDDAAFRSSGRPSGGGSN